MHQITFSCFAIVACLLVPIIDSSYPASNYNYNQQDWLSQVVQQYGQASPAYASNNQPLLYPNIPPYMQSLYSNLGIANPNQSPNQNPNPNQGPVPTYNPGLGGYQPPSVYPPAVPTLPPTQYLQSCDFDSSYKDLLGIINSVRQAVIARYLPPQASSSTTLCMNRKLMMAAKVQSNFQALANVPTPPAGPSVTTMNNLQNCLLWATFDRPPLTTSSSSSSLLPSPPLPPPLLPSPAASINAQGPSITVMADELDFFWPAVSIDMLSQKSAVIGLFQQAVSSWIRDPNALAILTNPAYSFFGMSMTRSLDDRLYLSIILAKSSNEFCNICPADYLNYPSASTMPYTNVYTGF